MTGDHHALIATPVGLPGSGRVRYGAAMALHRAGLLSDAVLEVYRICSPLDCDDPAALLTARGLPLPVAPAPGPLALIDALLAEADRYLSRLPGPGVAEVRAGIAAASAAQRADGRENPIVAAHLEPALSAVPDQPALVQAIRAAAPHLPWVTYDLYPRDQIGDAFADGHAFAEIIGPGAPVGAADFSFGLFLIAPGVLYRDHCHPAPELYAPLTGPHRWRFGAEAPLVIKSAHQPVWNEPDAPHLTLVGAVPFLCLYGWTQDIGKPARVIPALDWPLLEGAPIG